MTPIGRIRQTSSPAQSAPRWLLLSSPSERPNIQAPPMHLAELKAKSPADLLSFAESLQIENASSLRKQDMMFAILKNLADNEHAINGEGTLEILPDGFGFLRSADSNYLPGPDDIYVL